MNRSLTPTEEVLLQCLWESGEDLTVYEIMERLRKYYGRDYGQNAVSTFMKTLLKKGAVSRYKIHHSHQYHLEIDMEEYRSNSLGGFKNQWFHGSVYGMMVSLVETSDISAEEVQKLKKLLEKYTETDD